LTALVRIGLGLLLTLAPALCCCQARWLTAGATAAPAAPADPAPRPVPACPHCRLAESPAAPTSPQTPAPKPAPVSPHCIFCDGQGAVIPTDPQPQPEAPAFAGELLPLSGALWFVATARPAFATGLFPSERAGVDARSAALFDRHVLRC
jgi:hypothetical protein